MKITILSAIVLAGAVSFCAADIVTSGLIPKTPTFYVNTNYANNLGGESPGVAVAANGNVLIGWEDDGAEIFDFEAAWTLFDGNGNMLTQPTVQTNIDTSGALLSSYQSITNTFLSFFRSNGTATPAIAAWGPKIKANLFGNGLGHGATSFGLGVEVPELGPIQLDAGGGGDFPAVQILNNDGTPVRILTGVTDADAEPAGDIRIADWDYLANGNVVIAGESRQEDDLASRFGGSTARRHAVYRVVSATGTEVKGYSLVSATNEDRVEMWHGAGVTANGFGLRFNVTTSEGSPAGVKVRLFDNSGNPTSENLDLATVAGHPEAGGGGRGDSAGFHGNGKDAYVAVCSSGGLPWVTVLNADGTLRWSRGVAEATETINANRVDGAIAPDGRVIAVWDSPLANASPDVTNRLVQARLFSATGEPIGGRFAVSDWESAANPATTNIAEIPRVAWRNDTVAMVWLSRNAPTILADPLAPAGARVVAARLFSAAAGATGTQPVLTISRSGGNVTISWTGSGTLESADDVTGPWTPAGDTNPVTVGASGARKFFRVKAQ